MQYHMTVNSHKGAYHIFMPLPTIVDPPAQHLTTLPVLYYV